ncbi:MAG: hypothetical protein ACREPE_04235, partial [Lysobacter sp.]
MQTHNPKNVSKPRPHNLLVAALTFCATMLALPVHSVTMPDIPLQAGSPVAPNIMFILDDSGSMQGEIMPDELIYPSWKWTGSAWEYMGTNVGLVFPRANGVYGAGDYAHVVASTASTSAYGAMVRSQLNKIYYNPSVTYLPWEKEDGTGLYPAASKTCALHNPKRVGTTEDYCRDLTSATSTNFNGNYWQDY